MTETRHGVQYAALSGLIHAGTISDDGSCFTAKSDVTGQALGAVADWVEAQHEGGALVTLNDGRVLDIDVRPAHTEATQSDTTNRPKEKS